MSRRFRLENLYSAPPDRVLALLWDPAVQDALTRRQGALACAATLEDGAETAVLTLVEEREAMWGKEPDKSTMRVSFSKATRTATWERRLHGMEAWVHMRGTIAVEARGDGAAEIIEGEIAVEVPVLGRLIEKKVVREVEKAFAIAAAHYAEALARQ